MKNMGHAAPYSPLAKLPPPLALVETMDVLRQTSKAAAALAELKGIADSIPNQSMLVNAIVLQEAKDSSEIENIITSQDELYRAHADMELRDLSLDEVAQRLGKRLGIKIQ